MRLLQLGDDGELTLTRDISYNIPPYAILSHTWGTGLDDEVTLQDIRDNKGEEKPGYQKILFCGQQAERDGLKHFWVDTCCIDKTSSAELTEAINSMFRWYQNAQKCYVYLADVSNGDREADELARSTWKLAFRQSKWFSRGWTLQELIAPRIVEFFSSDCQRLGDKQSLAEMIHEITKLPTNAFQGASMAQFSVEERISWSKGRTTTRGEDKAYSLLGILDVSMTSIYGEGETKALERLRAKTSLRSTSGVLKQLPVAVGAAYDSHAEEHNQQCLAGTRTEVLSEIAEWVHDPSSQTVYWLSGMAGTGKSTISRTLARQFSESNELGATFFFKRGEGDVGGISKFFTTIVSQLIRQWPGMAEHVQAVIEEDPAIVSRALREQFQKLVIGPMSKISCDTDHRRSCLIIVDALDECEPQEDVKSLINLLSITKPLNSLHLKFFLTSRPELPIRMGFQAAKGTYQDFILHEVAQSAIEHDLTAYLKYDLGKIRDDFNQNGTDQLPADWPSQTALEMLIRIAVPLFISAATILRFIADSQLGNPEEQLEKVLKYEANDEFDFDKTYSPILYSMICNHKKTICEQIVARFKTVVGSIITLASPLSVFALAKLLDCKTSTIDATLVTLHSVLNVPKLPNQPIRLLHLSFRDFLVDPARRDDKFWIDEKKVHEQLASRCLRVLVDSLKTDICNVAASGAPASSISEAEINTHIPPQLQYSCRFWVYHLHESLPAALDTTGIWHFLSTRFLQWLEALSWMCRLSESVPMIKSLRLIIPGECPELENFISDSLRFMQAMNSCIQATPLQVYSSSLIFSPSQCIIRKCFGQDISSRFALAPEMPSYWGERLATLEGHKDKINSVMFSPDGKQVASGSDDCTVILWDVDTGERRQTLEGHSHWVQSVAFSPDGRWIASASVDLTVILWAANTGQLLYRSEEYSSPVKSVVFSPDNKLMALALEDGDIILEEAERHERWQTLKGHSASVNSVAFSPDSKLLASASNDKTIMLWVTDTGERRQTLEGHSGLVTSVTFSPDGKLLVSAAAEASEDSPGPVAETVIFWVAETGELRKTLDSPRYQSVNSVAISSDGKFIALALEFGDAALWEIDTGLRKRTFEAHYSCDPVNSVAFSPDGTLIASAEEETAFLWVDDMNEPQQLLEYHSSSVSLIRFSPDGKLVASAGGKTIIIWDANTGERRHILKGHSDEINTFEFWPNGQLLTSVSYQSGCITWETNTGKRRQTLKLSDLVNSIVFSPNAELMAVSSYDTGVNTWATDVGEHRQTLKHSSTAKSIAFSHSGSLLASGWYDGTVALWVVNSGERLQTLKGHEGSVDSVVFSPDDQLVASASAGNDVAIIIIWAANTGERLQTLKTNSNYVASTAFSPDGNLVAFVSDWEKLMVWTVDTGQCQHIVELGTHTNVLRFDERNEHVLTDVGVFAIGNPSGHSSVETSPSSNSAVPSPPTGARPVGYGISQDKCCLTLDGEMLLWLPLEYRPQSSAMLGSTVVIGCFSGRVLIFRLS